MFANWLSGQLKVAHLPHLRWVLAFALPGCANPFGQLSCRRRRATPRFSKQAQV
jgi:hypothetical protein